MRSHRFLTCIGVLVGLWVLTGCTLPGFTVSTGPVETTIAGRLAGESRGDAGCVWLESETGQRIYVSYPNGWHIEFDPLALFDEAGRRRAEQGDTLTVEGYFEEVGASVCGPQQTFVATRVAAIP